jgi:hypothetical protein
LMIVLFLCSVGFFCSWPVCQVLDFGCPS